MHLYKLLKAHSTASLDSVIGKHQGRRKAYEYNQLLNRSCCSHEMQRANVQRVGRVGEEKEERNHTNVEGLLPPDPFSLVVVVTKFGIHMVGVRRVISCALWYKERV